MNVLDVKKYPDCTLRIRTNPVTDFTSEIDSTIRKMSEIMYISQGVGLAAPQVGLDKSLVVIDVGDELLKLVNPEIVDTYGERTALNEGCLSLPEITVNVYRHEALRVRFQNVFGDFSEREFKGLEAKVVQHEIDHLEGKLIIDYLCLIRRGMAKAGLAMKKLKKTRNKRSCEVICHATKKDRR